MKCKGLFVLPHGALILDPKKSPDNEVIKDLNKAMNEISLIISRLRPELIFLSTPHGLSLQNNFGIYLNDMASGSAEWENEWKEFKVTLKIDHNTSKTLLTFLKDEFNKVEGITAFNRQVELPLRWGEVVPTYFLKNIDSNYIIMSQPSRRYDQAESMLEELKLLGQDIMDFLERQPKSYIIIISGDLAHTHQNSGPYGYSESAKKFDKYIYKWLHDRKSEYLIENAKKELSKALSCGFTGFIILDGMLKTIKSKKKLTIHSFGASTYYGMLIASILIDEKKSGLKFAR